MSQDLNEGRRGESVRAPLLLQESQRTGPCRFPPQCRCPEQGAGPLATHSCPRVIPTAALLLPTRCHTNGHFPGIKLPCDLPEREKPPGQVPHEHRTHTRREQTCLNPLVVPACRTPGSFPGFRNTTVTCPTMCFVCDRSTSALKKGSLGTGD